MFHFVVNGGLWLTLLTNSDIIPVEGSATMKVLPPRPVVNGSSPAARPKDEILMHLNMEMSANLRLVLLDKNSTSSHTRLRIVLMDDSPDHSLQIARIPAYKRSETLTVTPQSYRYGLEDMFKVCKGIWMLYSTMGKYRSDYPPRPFSADSPLGITNAKRPISFSALSKMNKIRRGKLKRICSWLSCSKSATDLLRTPQRRCASLRQPVNTMKLPEQFSEESVWRLSQEKKSKCPP